jgi:hypothetical protein
MKRLIEGGKAAAALLLTIWVFSQAVISAAAARHLLQASVSLSATFMYCLLKDCCSPASHGTD